MGANQIYANYVHLWSKSVLKYLAFILFLLKFKELVVSRTPPAAPSRNWTAKARCCEETTRDGDTPSENALWWPKSVAMELWEYKTVAGAHLGRALSKRLPNMDDRTDAEVVKEDLGRTMSTG